ncbi:MAG: UvrD-helicase domain-containing protein [Proteobacteria bacterium]|nr:UvrD-helicase domain-containing protein [Pseudomonadota bacterium]
MKYLADLHVHSRYSRATAKNADLENFCLWAQKKGVTLVGTGDCTHPGWFAELKEKLVPAEPGIFALSPEIAREVEQGVPASCRAPVRFVLSGEISCIYKKDGRTRKNHNLVLFPDFDSAEAFNRSLAAVGNIRSDGRPILGLDARDLLETALSACPEVIFIPAHIWTPWFSLLGSKSGFDSIAECFGDLTPHIRAVETGLSSDPPMNWRVPDLDGLTLVSHSDAHSPAKLMREANILDTDLSYAGLRRALDLGPKGGFAGTIEFFPEEGKYHLDGHRKCGVVLEPEETRRLGGQCPECGKPLTVGVLYRVHELAKREHGNRPAGAPPFHSLIPLADLLAGALGRGPATKGVTAAYEEALERFGPERAVLMDLPVESLREFRVPLLAEAVDRMRRGEVCLAGGYDGEFGTVRIFEDAERERLQGQAALFPHIPDPPPPVDRKPAASLCQAGLWDARDKEEDPKTPETPEDCGDAPLNPEQERAVAETGRPVLVVAGPGTGKTRTLVHRAARLVLDLGVDPERVIAVTFTTQAAAQLKSRLAELAPEAADRVFAGTFHALSLALLKERAGEEGVPEVAGQEDREFFLAEAVARAGGRAAKIPVLSRDISRAKQVLAGPDDPLPEDLAQAGDPDAFRALYRAYQEALARRNLMDFDDILARGVRLLEGAPEFAARRFSHVLVDEYQDINPAQYRLLKALCPDGAGLFAIGDPDQAIYGFRGADLAFFQRFSEDFPDARLVDLSANYRSVGNVLAAAERVIRPGGDAPGLTTFREAGPLLTVISTASPAAEAEAVVCAIEEAMGGTSLFAVDSGRAGDSDGRDWGFSDFAVLYRTRDQAGPVADALARSGIPFQVSDRKAALAGTQGARLVSLLRLARGSAPDPDVLRAISFLPGPVGKLLKNRLLALAAEGGKPLARLLKEMASGSWQGIPQAQALEEFFQALAEAAGDPGQSVEDALRDLAGRFLPATAPASPGSETPLEELLRLARNFRHDAEGFFTFFTTAADADLRDPRADRVTLATVHAAKGLEFPGVFVLGCEDGFFPLRLPGRKTDLDEERRLFYVAVTRAARRLWLLSAKRRMVRGRPVENPCSPFLEAISEALLDRRNPGRPRPPAKPVQKSLGFE